MPARSPAAQYDAHKDFGCKGEGIGQWSYEAYRASDGSYLDMIYGHPPLTEVSKYGVDGHYLPDGDQPYYPFIVHTPDFLMGSPATAGRRFDAVLGWTATEDAAATASGYVRLIGNYRGGAEGRTITAQLLHDGEVLWEQDVKSGEESRFDAGVEVKRGDRIRLRLVNAGDPSGNVAAFNMLVSTGD